MPKYNELGRSLSEIDSSLSNLADEVASLAKEEPPLWIQLFDEKEEQILRENGNLDRCSGFQFWIIDAPNGESILCYTDPLNNGQTKAEAYWNRNQSVLRAAELYKQFMASRLNGTELDG